jgi:uncharacterized protein
MFEATRAASRQARSLSRVGHRPYPLPDSRWTLGQTWEQTFWAHWPTAAADLRALVPAELEIEEYDGRAWIGIVFFRVRALRARGALPLPGISSFRQLNVRTYVRGPDSLPGVWFFSIDVSSRLAALGVRRIYHVPAFHARMTSNRVGGWQEAESVRIGEPGRVFLGRYRATGDSFHAEPGSLEWFLTERYRLFTKDARAEIHHDRWLLCPAQAEIELTSIAPLAVAGPPHCHVAFRQDALIWPPERVSA